MEPTSRTITHEVSKDLIEKTGAVFEKYNIPLYPQMVGYMMVEILDAVAQAAEEATDAEDKELLAIYRDSIYTSAYMNARYGQYLEEKPSEPGTPIDVALDEMNEEFRDAEEDDVL